ncbi:hypothetical protein F5148DRAFT_1232289 [Russula earlei]|uniref:Uncharacterized protein n=1 Tax=Russula earlei TaxID=71964 RepID=A0ACC0TZD2_9AGAM|nr:hypothetical protein F5148DRAFT_1232289 [Russula earlei]
MPMMRTSSVFVTFCVAVGVTASFALPLEVRIQCCTQGGLSFQRENQRKSVTGRCHRLTGWSRSTTRDPCHRYRLNLSNCGRWRGGWGWRRR